ncbi:lipopolysaccharide biosynthesis protein [Vibrio sp. V12_P9A6T4]|uniref:O-antigen translocase n=1 Tax=Vibrio sp. V12_P9A6T4 TaxID=1938667 RepID=UPI000B8E8ABB|nr:O-antigen translocase [Vibrio sp. V12_P9A6T4]OXX53565.1 lipopolysaccharide biosynthesis protein [Vibrio sp. V12_P9A6T4]
MNLVKTSFLSGIAAFVKIISVLVINKMLSVITGPGGLAIFAQFQNAQSIIATISQGGINTGVTKYTAEYYDRSDKKKMLWSASLLVTVIFTILASITTFFLSDLLSTYIFDSDSYSFSFKLLSASLIFYSINQLLLSILNGLKEIKRYICVNVIQSIFALIISVILIFFYGINGALIAMVANQSVIFFVILIALRNHSLIRLKNLTVWFNFEHIKNLSKYSLMTLVSAISGPVSYLFVRNYVGVNYSWESAGHWQAMMYISTMYLLVITTALSTYYLPKLSELSNKKELRTEIYNGYKIIIPIVIILSTLIYFLKDFIVWLLFTPDFENMKELFFWQMFGDVIKISSWLLSYIMLAKANVKRFVITEIAFSLSFSFLCVIFLQFSGIIGLSYAYAANYLLYLVCMVFLMRDYLYDK